jgi:hypothetical protein
MQVNKQGRVDISIMPAWPYRDCDLTVKQLEIKHLLPVPVLARKLEDIRNLGCRIGRVEIAAGELTLLPEEYLYSLKWILHYYGFGNIELITNLTSITSSVIHDDQFGLSVHYDFEHTEQQEKVWNNLVNLERPFSVLTMACDDVLKSDPRQMVEELNGLRRCLSWEIRPANVDGEEFDSFIKAITDQPNKRFEFYNTGIPQESIKRPADGFSEAMLHITPSGRYGLLEIGLDGSEYMLETDNIFQYLERITVQHG